MKVSGDGVQAQGGEGMGVGGGGVGGTSNVGQGGRVKLAVEVLEGGSTIQKLPRFVKPSGKRGVKRDSLIQTRIESLEARGGGSRITGLVKCVGKRKFPAESDSPGAKKHRLSLSRKPVL